MDTVALKQVVKFLGTAIENLMAANRILQDLLPKEEPQKEKVEEQCTPPPLEDSVESAAVDEEEVVVADEDLPRRRKDSSSTSPPARFCLDGKVSFTFEGTISVRE